jgi:hypothetical protein
MAIKYINSLLCSRFLEIYSEFKEVHMNSLLTSERVQELRVLGISEQFFDQCMEKVTTEDNKERKITRVCFKLKGFPCGALAWWESKPDTLEQVKAKVVYEVLSYCSSEEIMDLFQCLDRYCP